MHRILVFDSGHEWGGGTESLLALISRLDRQRFLPEAVFLSDYHRGTGPALGSVLEGMDIPFSVLPVMPDERCWYKPLREILRLLLCFSPTWRRAALAEVDFLQRVRPQACALAALLRTSQPQLLYANNQPSSNHAALLAAEQTGVQIVLHCRKAVPLTARERNTANRVLRRMICVSESLRDHYLEQGIHAGLCQVIPNGVDIELKPARPAAEMRALLGLPEDAFVVGTVGSLLSLKRVDILLDAVASARREVPALRCVVVGAGPTADALHARAGRLGISDAVVFAGFRADALDCINAFDVFALTSQQEGMPRVILEAMLMAKPVVATNVVGSRDLVRKGETGYLFPLDKPDMLAQHLVALAGDPGLCASLGTRARQIVVEQYSIDAYIQAVTGVFDEVLA